MAKHAYPATFTIEESGLIAVDFPNFDNCFTCGNNIPDALEMAADVLALTLCDIEKNGAQAPAPSNIKSIEAPASGFVSMVYCDTVAYLRKTDNRAVKKTLSIPSWLNEAAERRGVNFSSTLQRALMQELGFEN